MGAQAGCERLAVMSLPRLSVVAILVWILLLMYISTMVVKYPQSGVSVDEASYQTREATALEALERIKKASLDIEALKRQNEELKQILYDSSNQMAKNLGERSDKRERLLQKQREQQQQQQPESDVGQNRAGHLSAEHEILRRQLENGIQEFWYRTRAELSRLSEKADQNAGDLKDHVRHVTAELKEQHRTLQADALRLGQVDQARQWRNQQLGNLSSLVTRRLDWLQNNNNCSHQRKLLCNLNKGCGFGCQIHHATYCFMMAYGTQRTLFLDTSTWRYSKTRSWQHYFQPVLGPNCANALTDSERENAVLWSEQSQQDAVVSVPIVDGLRNPPPFLPLSFPADLADQLLHLHGAPPVWWVAQFVSYLMRPSAEFYAELTAAERKIGLGGKDPTVGVHIRRTDKVGAEAAYHSLDEYMAWVDDWFRVQELVRQRPLKRRVYLATDDPDVLAEAQNKYPDYSIEGDRSIAESAQLNRRYTDASLRGILLDIHLLSKSDHLVCTFSSQVCRVAYELMQQWRGDAAGWFHSLDDIYYFGGQQAHQQRVWLAHDPADAQELQLNVNDTLGVAGNHWDGWSKGKSARTQRTGLYPSYKVRERWRIAQQPDYKHVK